MAKPAYQDYVDSGVLVRRPVEPCWLVRTATGHQFSTHLTRETADKWADKIGGTVEWYTPIQSNAHQNIGATHDH